MMTTTMTVREYLGEDFVKLYIKAHAIMLATIEGSVGTVEAERIADKVFDKAMNCIADDERIAKMPKSINAWIRYLVKGVVLEKGHYLQLKRSKVESLDVEMEDEEGEVSCRMVDTIAAPEDCDRLAVLETERMAVWPTVRGILKRLGVGKTTQQVFIRRAWFDQEYKDIARDLGITVNNCQQKYFRVKQRLEEVGPKIYRQMIGGWAA